jgi:hypothetical protein
VVPAPYTPDDVASTGRVEIGDAASVTVDAADGVGLLTFDGRHGQHVAVGVEGDAFGCSVDYGLVGPGGVVLVDPQDWRTLPDECGAFPDIPRALPTDGTYTISIAPRDRTGSVEVTVDEAAAPDPTATDGDAGPEDEGDDAEDQPDPDEADDADLPPAVAEILEEVDEPAPPGRWHHRTAPRRATPATRSTSPRACSSSRTSTWSSTT